MSTEVKTNSDRTLKWSGTSLLLILAGCLGIAIFAFDWFTGRISDLRFTLSLPFWVCAVAAALVGYWVVPLLRSLKAGQFIREDGPQAHLKKAGTPTMGGIFFIPVGVLGAIAWSGFHPTAIALSILTVGYGAIGWLDDWQILRRRSNKGISPRMKLMLQTGLGVLFSLWLMATQPAELTQVALPFGLSLPLGLLFWPLAVGVLVSESNALNLTDGLDGLAGGTGAIALLGLAVIVAPTSPEVATFCACMSGSCLGFLVHNRNPATVFMGDTGSMALGGAVTGAALVTNTLWALLLVGGIFFVETLSVMAQVSYYKATKGPDGVGKRLLKMAPLHHHLELSGWSELRVVGTFYLVGGILALVSFGLGYL
ncbi:phospho-N-acetylmuramoyl-pentapeptide-transferase [Kamptonema cortianum]|nr:phospho-N-acetylmuramoyl-pentapeptide-transferase [Kamptonema cortianum]MDL5052949.1 phospho-N-acetylmuramoyl-pentapeptide-transferase [Oscillatoria laete-virens NRMC-F 0139]